MPKVLAGIGLLVMAVSGSFAAGLFGGNSAPAGAIASDSVTIAVGQSSLVTGPNIGLMVGAALLLASLGWELIRRKMSASEPAKT